MKKDLRKGMRISSGSKVGWGLFSVLLLGSQVGNCLVSLAVLATHTSNFSSLHQADDVCKGSTLPHTGRVLVLLQPSTLGCCSFCCAQNKACSWDLSAFTFSKWWFNIYILLRGTETCSHQSCCCSCLHQNVCSWRALKGSIATLDFMSCPPLFLVWAILTKL